MEVQIHNVAVKYKLISYIFSISREIKSGLLSSL